MEAEETFIGVDAMSILLGVHGKEKSNLFYSFFPLVYFVSNNRECEWGGQRERRRKKRKIYILENELTI